MHEPSKYHISEQQLLGEKDQIEAAQKDPAKFDVIYNRYYQQILKFVYQRLDSKEQAYDITSQVFLKALVNLKLYQHKGLPFSAWLYRIAINELNLLFRTEKAERALNVTMSSIKEMMHEMHNDTEEKYEQLMKALTQLDEDDLQLIEMRFFEKRTFKEIAEILNITEINAKTKTYRILEKMKQKLSK